MFKFIPLALLVVALPATAQAQDPREITVEAPGHSVQKTKLSPRTYKLAGQLDDGRHFRLSVKDRRVSGQVDGVSVSFLVEASGRSVASRYYAQADRAN